MLGAENTAAIVLAAGLSRRMGQQDKLLLPLGEGTLLSRTLELVAGIAFRQRIVVSTPQRLAAVAVPPGFQVVENSRPEEGQASSVRLGTAAAHAGQYLFLVADQPLLDRAVIGALLAHGDGRHIVFPWAEGRPSGPTLFPAALRTELLALEGDLGGRAVRRAHPELCRPVPIPADFLRDIDTWADYRALLGEADPPDEESPEKRG